MLAADGVEPVLAAEVVFVRRLLAGARIPVRPFPAQLLARHAFHRLGIVLQRLDAGLQLTVHLLLLRQLRFQRDDIGAVNYEIQKAKNFLITDTGWVADFNDAYNFLYLLDSRTGPMNYGAYTNPAYDALLDQSAKETDVAKRGEVLRQAEQTMLNDTAVLPLLIRVTQDIVSPNITGYEDNPEDIHRTRYMCRKK